MKHEQEHEKACSNHKHSHCCGYNHKHEHEHEHCHSQDGYQDHCCGHDHEHAGSFDIGCSCGHDHGQGNSKWGRALLITGAILFAASLFLEHAGTFNNAEIITFVLCLIAYLLLGYNVLIGAGRNLLKGQIFDEYFLMSVATIAAFAIGDFPEAVGVMLFFRIGELFEHVSVERSRATIAEAVDMRPETVTLVGGRVIAASEAKPGDILEINPGERIPLDGMVVSGRGQIDTSPVTGEPMPIIAGEGAEILSGCINLRGQIQMRVTAPLEESMVSRILNSVENAAETKPQIEKFITKFARIYTPIVVILAVLIAVIPPVIMSAGGEATADIWHHYVVTAVTFLVISCPCAMIISVPLAFFLGIGSASKKGILFKNGLAVEAMRKIKIVALDKTGTITAGIVEDRGLLEISEEEKSADFEEAFAKKTVTEDRPKPDAKTGIRKVRNLGIKVAMLTGDKKDRAEAVGEEVGIDADMIRSQLMPDEKLSTLQKLREDYGEILFVGDGINDAPVLAGADVGAAMGAGADAAIEAADVVFMNSNVEAIPEAIKTAKRTGKIAGQNIALALGVKLLVLTLGALGMANIWLAVFADTGVCMLCILNALRLLKK